MGFLFFPPKTGKSLRQKVIETRIPLCLFSAPDTFIKIHNGEAL